METQPVDSHNMDSIRIYLRTLTEHKIIMDSQLDELALQNENLKVKVVDYQRQIKDSIKETQVCAIQTYNEEASMSCQTETLQTQDECVGEKVEQASVSVDATIDLESVETQVYLETKNNEIQTELSNLIHKEIKVRDYNSQRDISIMTEKPSFCMSKSRDFTIKNAVKYTIANEENFTYFPPNLETEVLSFNLTPRGCKGSPICMENESDGSRIDIEWEEHIESDTRKFTNLTVSTNINEFQKISPYAFTTEASSYITESPESQPRLVLYEDMLTIKQLVEEKELELKETIDRLTELEYENTELRKNLNTLKLQQAAIKMQYCSKINKLQTHSTQKDGKIEELKRNVYTISSQNDELKLNTNRLEQELESQKQLNAKLHSKNLARYDKEVKMNLLKHNNRVLQILNQHLKYERDMILHTTCSKDSYNTVCNTYLQLEKKFSTVVESLSSAHDKNLLYEQQIQALTQETETLKQQLETKTISASRRERVKDVKKKLQDLYLLIEDKF